MLVLKVIIDKAKWKGAVLDWFASLDLNIIGYIIVGLFVLTWVVALTVWHFGKIEDRWSNDFHYTGVPDADNETPRSEGANRTEMVI